MEQKRICRVCKDEKDLIEFSKHKKGKNGYDNICKKCNCAKSKIYYINNEEKVKEHNKTYSKIYHENNKDDVHAYHKIYYEKNIESKKIYAKKYNEENKEINYLREKARKKHKRKTDPAYRIEQDMRTRIYMVIKNYRSKYKVSKKDFVLSHLGISISKFVEYLEKQFLPEMNWDNHGKIWEIDHIIPCASFNLLDENECKKCFHYSNHQPLFTTTEIAKSFGYENYIGNRNKYKNILKK